MLGQVNAGERAHIDQVLALIEDIDRAWPFNQGLMADSECERVVLDRLGDEWQGMRDDRAYLLWGNGRLVEVEADALSIGGIARRTMPDPRSSECDRCRVVGAVGVAVVACPRNLVPLLLCGTCADRLNPELLIREDVS